jgi:hypothetical protein
VRPQGKASCRPESRQVRPSILIQSFQLTSFFSRVSAGQFFTSAQRDSRTFKMKKQGHKRTKEQKNADLRQSSELENFTTLISQPVRLTGYRVGSLPPSNLPGGNGWAAQAYRSAISPKKGDPVFLPPRQGTDVAKRQAGYYRFTNGGDISYFHSGSLGSTFTGTGAEFTAPIGQPLFSMRLWLLREQLGMFC